MCTNEEIALLGACIINLYPIVYLSANYSYFWNHRNFKLYLKEVGTN